MTLTAGLHHLALVTEDIDRFVRFYTDIFDAEVIAELDEDGLRHAMLGFGSGASLHVFEQRGNPHARASTTMFGRGHLDHFGVSARDSESFETLRRRLVEAGASDGTITDFGMVWSVSFIDPDGCDAEVALWQEGPVRTFAERGRIPYP